jgi:hypothetical protein
MHAGMMMWLAVGADAFMSGCVFFGAPGLMDAARFSDGRSRLLSACPAVPLPLLALHRTACTAQMICQATYLPHPPCRPPAGQLYLKVSPALGCPDAQSLIGSAGWHLADVALPAGGYSGTSCRLQQQQQEDSTRAAAQLLVDCAADVLRSEGVEVLRSMAEGGMKLCREDVGGGWTVGDSLPACMQVVVVASCVWRGQAAGGGGGVCSFGAYDGTGQLRYWPTCGCPGIEAVAMHFRF